MRPLWRFTAMAAAKKRIRRKDVLPWLASQEVRQGLYSLADREERPLSRQYPGTFSLIVFKEPPFHKEFVTLIHIVLEAEKQTEKTFWKKASPSFVLRMTTSVSRSTISSPNCTSHAAQGSSCSPQLLGWEGLRDHGGQNAVSVLYSVDGGLASPQFLLQDPKPL